MALRNIVYSDQELIRKKCKEVKNFDDNLCTLLDDMNETMKKYNGTGIAAPQVGVLKRVCIVENNGQHFELVNPVITKQSGSQENIEGCLSVKEHNGLVKRPYKITVKAQDRYGYEFTITVEDFTAVVFCHEIDHLDGILFTDRASKLYKRDEMEGASK